jgi:hypothetical protein
VRVQYAGRLHDLLRSPDAPFHFVRGLIVFMLSFMRSRPGFAKALLLLLLAVQAAGVIARIWASAAPSGPAGQASALAERRPSAADATRALDRFLDHHPLLEEKLRVSPGLVHDADFLVQNPELRDFARSNPEAVTALNADPRHLLYRALFRQANASLHLREFEVFGELFDHEPPLERALSENPECIRDPEFVKRHLALKEFLLQRPRLAAVFSTPPSAKENR